MDIDCGVCRLRPYRASDGDSIAELANDYDVWINLRDLFPHPYRRADFDSYFEHSSKQDPVRTLAIVVDGRAVGSVGVVPGADIERVSGEIGYWLGKPFWGRGIATAAVKGATRRAVAQFGFTRVFAIPFVENIGSIRVLEKAGFVREGLMKQSAIKAGKLRDQYLYAWYA